MGGAWERLIRSIKIALSVALKDQSPREETLLTTLSEIAVNSRPLTHIAVDPRDQESLTPNHFLIGASSDEIRFGNYHNQSQYTRKQWCIAEQFANILWSRWLHEYLPTLIPRKKCTENVSPLEVGDLVLLLDENVARNHWRKGIITRTFVPLDGQVRRVEVKTALGVLELPFHKLVKFARRNVPNVNIDELFC